VASETAKAGVEIGATHKVTIQPVTDASPVSEVMTRNERSVGGAELLGDDE